MPTSTEKSSQKLFETITALTAALDAAEAQSDFERAAEIEALREQIAELVKAVPSTWPGAPPAGAGAPKTWPAEAEKQRALQKQLVSLRDKLLDLVTNDGPSQPSHHIMRKAFASSAEIVLLMVLGFVGTITTLYFVIDLWPRATPHAEVPAELLAEASARPSSSASASASVAASASNVVPADGATPPSTDEAVGEDDADGGVPRDAGLLVPGDGPADAGVKDAGLVDAGSADGGADASSDAATVPKQPAPAAKPEAPELERAIAELKRVTNELDKKKRPVSERNVLMMIVLMGALGGFVHLTSSLAKYVGSRKLLRSWIIYYLLMPVSGAGLAPMIYLLLRVGVLGDGTGEMNVFGLYAFAAMTGLFAEQALEMLADIFSRIFAKPSTKDSLDAAKSAKKGT